MLEGSTERIEVIQWLKVNKSAESIIWYLKKGFVQKKYTFYKH